MQTNKLPRACFAPPLTDELLAQYEQAITALPNERGELRDALGECYAACMLWWGLPESPLAGDTFTYVRGDDEVSVQERPLPDEVKQALYDVIPWPREIEGMRAVFDEIPTSEKALRDMAFHLLWHVIELSCDREPLTLDKLPV